jgi:hypothetical protein
MILKQYIGSDLENSKCLCLSEIEDLSQKVNDSMNLDIDNIQIRPT